MNDHPSLAATFSEKCPSESEGGFRPTEHIYGYVSERESELRGMERERERTPLMIAYVFMIFL